MEHDFQEDGFTIIPGVFGSDELDQANCEADKFFGFSQSERDEANDDVRWFYAALEDGRRVLRGVQNLFLVSEVFDALRNDRRILDILAPLIGPELRSPVCTLFWKPPGERASTIAYHQDSSFRRPPEKFRNLGTSYAQVGIALDDHGPDNGGMVFVPGSHKKGDLTAERRTSILVEGPKDLALAKWGFSESDKHFVQLQKGDVVVWSPFIIHGSPANRSEHMNRRFFVNGYMRREDCDVGADVFLDA